MPKTSRNVYKRKDGRWEGRYVKARINGRAVYASVYAHSYKDVKQKLYEAKENRTLFSEQQIGEDLKDISQKWLETAKEYLKESSLNKYEDLLKCYVYPLLGEKRISEISDDDLTHLCSILLLQGGKRQKGLSESTVIEIISVLNNVKKYALQREIAVKFNPEYLKIRKDSSDIRIFSVDEEKRLIKYLCANINTTSLAILLCLLTGLRVGEICALRWEDFDFQRNVFHVCKTMQRVRQRDGALSKTTVKLLSPKSKSSIRYIPIPENLLDMLKKEYVQSSFILTGDPNRYVEPRTLQNRFKAILKKAQIDDANFHAIRHTFATRCIEQGFDTKCLSEIMGHASVAITLDKYVHPGFQVKTAQMSKLSEAFPLYSART